MKKLIVSDSKPIEVTKDMLSEISDGFYCDLEDSRGNRLSLFVVNEGEGYEWYLTEDGVTRVADSDFILFSTLQAALDDFNDWTAFNA